MIFHAQLQLKSTLLYSKTSGFVVRQRKSERKVPFLEHFYCRSAIMRFLFAKGGIDGGELKPNKAKTHISLLSFLTVLNATSSSTYSMKGFWELFLPERFNDRLMVYNIVSEKGFKLFKLFKQKSCLTLVVLGVSSDKFSKNNRWQNTKCHRAFKDKHPNCKLDFRQHVKCKACASSV